MLNHLDVDGINTEQFQEKESCSVAPFGGNNISLNSGASVTVSANSVLQMCAKGCIIKTWKGAECRQL